MIDKDDEHATDVVTSESKTIKSQPNGSTMLPVDSILIGNSTTEEQSAQNLKNDQNNGVIEQESENNQLIEGQMEEEEQHASEDDEFIRITAAHQMLTEGIKLTKKNIFLFFTISK